VSATLDTLAMETEDVVIVAEHVQPIRQCLIAREALELQDIESWCPPAGQWTVRTVHPHALPGARVMTTSSTADAVRMVSEHGGPGRRWELVWPLSCTTARCCAREWRIWPTTRPGSCGWPGPARTARDPGLGSRGPPR